MCCTREPWSLRLIQRYQPARIPGPFSNSGLFQNFPDFHLFSQNLHNPRTVFFIRMINRIFVGLYLFQPL